MSDVDEKCMHIKKIQIVNQTFVCEHVCVFTNKEISIIQEIVTDSPEMSSYASNLSCLITSSQKLLECYILLLLMWNSRKQA